jgi:hypothetical protein
MATSLNYQGILYADNTQSYSLARFKRAIFAFGNSFGRTNITNQVNINGLVATNIGGVGTARQGLTAAGYGGDKGILAFGDSVGFTPVNIVNLISNIGVVATDVTTSPTNPRSYGAAASYGGDKAISGYGVTTYGSSENVINKISNIGVLFEDMTTVGTARTFLAAASYGGDKAIFGYGANNTLDVIPTSITNLVSNTGVVSTDVTGVGTARSSLAATGYGGDKAIFGYGRNSAFVRLSITNFVSNTGVVSSDVTGVGTPRIALAASSYGGDKAIFGYGSTTSDVQNMTNLVSNTGVVSSDVTGVGYTRSGLAAAGFGS